MVRSTWSQSSDDSGEMEETAGSPAEELEGGEGQEAPRQAVSAESSVVTGSKGEEEAPSLCRRELHLGPWGQGVSSLAAHTPHTSGLSGALTC